MSGTCMYGGVRAWSPLEGGLTAESAWPIQKGVPHRSCHGTTTELNQAGPSWAMKAPSDTHDLNGFGVRVAILK